MRAHGYSKRRTWRKFHLGIDVNSQTIRAVTVTTNDFKDSEVLQITASINDIMGDGAYDSKNCYDACQAINANPIFPPREGAVIHQH